MTEEKPEFHKSQPAVHPRGADELEDITSWDGGARSSGYYLALALCLLAGAVLFAGSWLVGARGTIPLIAAAVFAVAGIGNLVMTIKRAKEEPAKPV